jgi:hypothetical protein
MLKVIGYTYDTVGTIIDIVDSISIKVQLDGTGEEIIITHPVEYKMEVGLIVIVDVENKTLGSINDIIN